MRPTGLKRSFNTANVERWNGTKTVKSDRLLGMILLIGFMGAGKSTLGPLLALCLNLPFLDLDHEIEQAAGIPLSEVFARDGEQVFRSLELARFRLLVPVFNGVLATGGGLPCQREAESAIRSCERVLYLNPPVDVLLERLLAQGDSRPLLAGQPKAQRADWLRRMHAERDPVYRSFGEPVALPGGESIPRQLDRLLDAVRGHKGGE